jgi:hypothetical protein
MPSNYPPGVTGDEPQIGGETVGCQCLRPGRGLQEECGQYGHPDNVCCCRCHRHGEETPCG